MVENLKQKLFQENSPEEILKSSKDMIEYIKIILSSNITK